ncbi:hypothetical protein ACA910_001694 [Epithemia clementina (nom. ined.)]
MTSTCCYTLLLTASLLTEAQAWLTVNEIRAPSTPSLLLPRKNLCSLSSAAASHSQGILNCVGNALSARASRSKTALSSSPYVTIGCTSALNDDDGDNDGRGDGSFSNSTTDHSYLYNTRPTTTTRLPTAKATIIKREGSQFPITNDFNHINHSNDHTYPYSPSYTNAVVKSYFAQSQRRRFRVYCDLDGVLVDFCHGIRNLYLEEELKRHGWCPSSKTSFSVDDLHRRTMWERVGRANSFFEHLPWIESGRSLWQVVQQLEPAILTGVPAFPRESRQQKVEWCRRELGIPIIAHTDMAGHDFRHVPVSSSLTVPSSASLYSPSPLLSSSALHDSNQRHPPPSLTSSKSFCHIITCWSRNKHYESGPGAVLIDDRIDLKAAWEAKGGIFIHHRECADETIEQLERVGVLDEFSYSTNSNHGDAKHHQLKQRRP